MLTYPHITKYSWFLRPFISAGSEGFFYLKGLNQAERSRPPLRHPLEP